MTGKIILARKHILAQCSTSVSPEKVRKHILANYLPKNKLTNYCKKNTPKKQQHVKPI